MSICHCGLVVVIPLLGVKAMCAEKSTAEYYKLIVELTGSASRTDLSQLANYYLMATDHQLHKKLYNDCFTIKEIHQLQFSLDN